MRTCNPTVFVVRPDDAEKIMWLVDNPEPLEVVMPSGRKIIQSPAQERLDLIKQVLSDHDEIFATFYRPGAFWEEEVFVCPKCKHATQIEFAESIAPAPKTLELARWWCKYCYTAWDCSGDRGMLEVEIEDDA